jgi:uncharacterized protein (TIGR03437 family)
MKRLKVQSTIAILMLGLPVAALADLSGTQTLNAGQTLNLDTGTVGTSGGDIVWNDGITFGGLATGINLGALGAQGFGALSQQTLSLFGAFDSFPIPASSLIITDVFAVLTNGGHYAAVLVTAVSGTSITLQFTTFGVTSAPTGPTITEVLNNYDLIPGGFPNSSIAPSTLIVIQGSLLASPSAQVLPLQSSAAPGLPTTLNGATVNVTQGSTVLHPGIYYAIAGQLAVVLPAATPLGSVQISVTYNNQTSAPFTINVVQSSFGFDPYYGTGSGLGVATNAVTGTLYNYSNSIPPGTNVVFWGSGLGANPGNDTTFLSGVVRINTLAHIYVGGIDSTIIYEGNSGYPGVNQINVTIPPNAPAGCNVPVVGVTASGTPTNTVTIPIGTGSCSDPLLGISGSTFQTLSGNATVNTGILGLFYSVEPVQADSRKARAATIRPFLTAKAGPAAFRPRLEQAGMVDNFAFGDFEQVNGQLYGAGLSYVSVGACIIDQALTSTGSLPTFTGLDAGTITVTGPSPDGPQTLMELSKGQYDADLPGSYISTSGGTFAINGSGGANIGPFNTQIVFPNPLLNWTNQSAAATVSRSAGLPVTWTGGAPNTLVYIFGSSSGTTSNGLTPDGSFTCIVPVGLGQFTVPSYILGGLPAGMGDITVANYSNVTNFTATGLNIGEAIGYVSYDQNATFQ